MRFLLASFLLLLVSSVGAFTEFNYLFKEEDYALLKVALSPHSCRLPIKPLTAMDRFLIPLDEAAILGHYDRSLSNYGWARKVFSSGGNNPVISLSLLGFPAALCNSFALLSLREASAAMEQTFKSLDSRFGELDLLQGDSSSISSSVSSRKKEYGAQIREARGESEFSISILKTRDALAIPFDPFEKSSRKLGAIWAIMEKGGSLENAIAFEKEMIFSISALQEQQQNLSLRYLELLPEAENDVAEIRLRALKEVRLDSLPAFDAPSLSSSDLARNFYQEEMAASELVKNAQIKRKAAERALSSKHRGYLADSINWQIGAIELLEEAILRSDKLRLKADGIEARLQLQLEALEGEAGIKIGENGANPVLYGLLKKKWAAYQLARERESPDLTQGMRINSMARAAELLSSLISFADSSDSIAKLLSELRAGSDRLSGILKLAKEDGLDVQEEEKWLFDLAYSLDSMDMEDGAVTLFGLGEELTGVEESIRKKTEGKYAPLAGEYWELLGYAEFLQPRDRATLDSYLGLFDGDSLSFPASLGKLSKLQSFIERAFSELDAKKPGILTKHLSEMLVIGETISPAPLGGAARITAYVSLENLIGLNADVVLSLPLPNDARLLNASKGLVAGQTEMGPYLKLDGSDGRYFAVFEYSQVVNALMKREERIVHADFNRIVQERSYEFRTEKASSLTIEIDAPSSEYAVAYTGQHHEELEGGKLALLLDAFAGDNKLKVEFTLRDPFELAIEEKAIGNSSMAFEFKYVNAGLDVPSARLEYAAATDCEILRVSTLKSDFKFVDKSARNYLAFILDASEWGRGEAKSLAIQLTCSNAVSDLLREHIAGIYEPSTLLGALALENSKQELSEGDYAKALEYLEQAEDLGSVGRDALLDRMAGLSKARDYLLTENYEKEFSIRLGKILEATSLEADSKMAAKMLEEAAKAADELLEIKRDFAEAECKAGCNSELLEKLGRLSAATVSKNYQAAFKAAFEFEQLSKARKDGDALAIAMKIEAISGLEGLVLGAGSASAVFESSFFATEEYLPALKADGRYKAGNAARESLQKGLRKLAEIQNAIETNSSSKYSLSLIADAIASAKSDLAELEEANGNMAALAEKELSEFQKRAKQFGDLDAADALGKAESEFQDGHHFLSYSISREWNADLLPSAPKQTGSDITLFAIPAIAILLGISYFVLFKRNGELIVERG